MADNTKHQGPMFTADDVAKISAAAAAEAVKATLAQFAPKEDMSQDEKFDAFVAGKSKNRPPIKEERFKCVCPDTKARFVAVVVPSRAHPEGRIHTIEDHEYPAESLSHTNEGGHVPEGMVIRHPQTGQLELLYRKWRADTYYIPILQLAGKSAKKLAPFREAAAAAATT